MSVVLTYAAAMPVVKIGRIAGQYAKPRSKPIEEHGGLSLPSYRGDAVNASAFRPEERVPDPQRLKDAYHASAATLNLIRAFHTGAVTDAQKIRAWSQNFTGARCRRRYAELTERLGQALRFMEACGASMDGARFEEFYTSHEGLLLDYETALTRPDGASGGMYNAGAHLLWLGERTRRLDEAHVAYFASITNPVAVKLGPSADPTDALALAEKLNPARVEGRLTFISRLGANRVRELLPPMIDKIVSSGIPVVWVCDPMHANTVTASNGLKTRHFDSILEEVTGFFETHQQQGSVPGGLHLELSGNGVTECLGGSRPITANELPERYESACDPRLNHDQALDLAFCVADLCSAAHPSARPEQPSKGKAGHL